MKLHTKLRFAVDMIVQNPLHFLVSVLLCGIGIALIGFTLLVYMVGKNGRSSAEKTLTEGIACTGIIEIDDLLSGDTMKFRELALNSGIIHSIGAYHFGMFNKDVFPELYDIQHNKEVNRSNTDSGNSLQMLIVDKAYSMEDGIKELKKAADTLNLNIRVYPLQEKFNRAFMETKIMEESLSEMLVLIFISIAIIVTLLQIVEILHHFHTYGIMYSVGFLSSEIIIMMAIRNFIYYILSLCTGLLLLFGVGKKYFITNIQVANLFFELLFKQVFPAGILIMLFLFCIITIVPCIVLKRLDPVELIQNN